MRAKKNPSLKEKEEEGETKKRKEGESFMYLLMPARAFRRKHEPTPGKRDDFEIRSKDRRWKERRGTNIGTRERERKRERDREKEFTM